MRWRVAPAAGLTVLLASCSGTGTGGEATLDVLAAASLTGAFQRLEAEFETQHPEVDVRVSLGSSATLARQVLEGAPADVLATADEATMQVAVDGDGVVGPQPFASNETVLVTTTSNPAAIGSIADLDDEGTDYVVCVETAPCGAVAAALLERNRIARPPRSYQPDVKAVEQLVLSGEVDAGLVYASDAAAHPDRLLTFPVPGSDRLRNRYLVAVATQSGDRRLADAWVQLLLSDRGRAVLDAEGFGPAQAGAG